MALLHIRFEDIDESHLRRLLVAGIAESRDIEYKRQPYTNSDNDKAECLADISSFANTAGGDILVGIDAKDGIPLKLVPLTGSADADILWVEDLARSCLQPRVNLRCRAIALNGGGHILLIRVPRSYDPPHRMIRKGKGENRFYARHSAGKYEPNVDELRALFTLAPTLTERVRNFRIDRIAKIAAGAAPTKLQAPDAIVLHVIPLSAFGLGAAIPLGQLDEQPHAFPPLGSRSPAHRLINFDGALNLSNADGPAKAQRAYVQIFRNGIVEAVYAGFANRQAMHGNPMMKVPIIEGTLLTNGLRYLKSLVTLGVEPPFAIVVSLVNVKDLTIGYAHGGWPDADDIVALDRDQLHFGEVVVESVPQNNQELAAQIRPIFEQLANAAGLANSPSFDGLAGYLPTHA
ncbi:MAG: ATP-binding protein [Pseudomonadota bacterium]|uniref:AlbA family DNA-binding domain-containing protein n=1 Tax=Phenylobacterium sp. TaxID=1871053 RepID=UPI0025CB8A67|nr:ATP-binding protein [Phenylobacterium sp.]MBT9471812.1 ATP-binding protein [Phenylobacterium sp.]